MVNNTSKYLHKLITRISYDLRYENPQALYRVIYAEIELKHGFEPVRTKKQTKLQSILSQGLLSELLTILLSLRRKGTVMTKKQILTGSCDKLNLEGVRHYNTPHGSFPSVTAVLDAAEGGYKDVYIQKWKDNLIRDLGATKAQNTMALATKVGDFHHAMLELWLTSADNPDRDYFIKSSTVRYMRSFLERIDTVIAVEYPVWSYCYKYAGTLDCVATLDDGKTYLLDWKTSAKAKNRSGIKNYYYQCAAYALAFYQRTGIKVDGFKIAITYREVVGKRNPRRFDLFECDAIQEYLDVFLEKAEFYHRNDQLNNVIHF